LEQKLLHLSLFYILLIAIIINYEHKKHSNKSIKPLVNIAHRGASGYAPENTIAAFDKAVEMNADYIELDVQRSKDHKLVVIHDMSIDRTTNKTGLVKKLSYKKLKRLDAGSWFHESYQHEYIPTLEEILNRYKKKKIGFLIELKDPHHYPGIEYQVAKAIKTTQNPIIVQSFNSEAIKKFHCIAPFVPTGLLLNVHSDPITDEFLQTISTYTNYINLNILQINSELVNQIHHYKMKILSWVINHKETIPCLYNLNIDGMITDYPDLLTKEEKQLQHLHKNSLLRNENSSFTLYELLQYINYALKEIRLYLPYIYQAADSFYHECKKQKII
jgi:glycerophosphoryl diester phosphodiesterase